VRAAGTAPQQPVCTPEIAALRRENSQLREALGTRAVIEQAKGALIWRFRLSDDAAFALLRRWSQSSNVRLHTVADILVNVVCRGETTQRTWASELADWLRAEVAEPQPVPARYERTAYGRG
jgi:hypothetical protein